MEIKFVKYYNEKVMVSVIIPIYNQEKNIENCILSLKKQGRIWHDMQIILVNDGSEDGSNKVCIKMQKKYSNILYISQENKGVSAARNAGIKRAIGRYIFFLDADDCISRHTIKNIIKFFDAVQEEVDLVTYPIETKYKGKILEQHFRYKYLNKSGVYDLRIYPYIGQTTMNIVVKNKYENNILFDENQTFSEDQKYCCDVLEDKLKMGFCKNGKYIYHRSDNSSSGKLAGACYIFEQCTSFFEQLFAKYEEVPIAFQGLFVNDFYWKLRENILFPYNYTPKEYDIAVVRLKELMKKCENRVILEHPNIDFFEKYYLLRFKENSEIEARVNKETFGLYERNRLILKEHSMEIVITKIYSKNNILKICGFIKSVFLQFYQGKVYVCAIENNGKVIRELKIRESSHNYYLSHEPTQKFKAFTYECNINEVNQVEFQVGFGKYWFPTHFYYMYNLPVYVKGNYYKCEKRNCRISIKNNSCFFIEKKAQTEMKDIWLYYDCIGTIEDNGFLQFSHDIEVQDGIIRYYVITDKKQKRYAKYKNFYVEFGSKKHKELLRRCSKIITAYIEEANLFPYSYEEYKRNAKDFDFEIIYLQHGVLHAIMPWKFSSEKILADRIVVSTKEEAQLYEKSGYRMQDLIKTGMPRFEMYKKAKTSKKILYAPSWRSYLVGNYVKRKWQPLDEKFLKSRFYIQVKELLESDILSSFLTQYGYILEIKLHPIFQCYKKYFDFTSSNICFVEESDKEEYDLFITDYSSYAFNFLYLDIPVLYYIPDIMEFKAGMNGYHQLNYPKDFWNNVVTEKESLVKSMKDVLIDGKTTENYSHFYKLSNVRDEIYKQVNI